MALDPAASSNSALATSTQLSGQQTEMLGQLEGPDRARMEAQMKLQNYQEVVSFISNMMKKRNEIAMADGWRTISKKEAPLLLVKAKYHRATRPDVKKQPAADGVTAA